MQPKWDIFCDVVDNFGDIGVTFRLAKQLVAEYNLIVSLWVNDLDSFTYILPQLDKSKDMQIIQGVVIKSWNDSFVTTYTPGDVLIEAFACSLPKCVIEEIKKNPVKAPVWINLEYLSAEQWIDECHGLVSSAYDLVKYFFFPGFTPKSGGLICEADLLQRRDLWQKNITNKNNLLAKYGVNTATNDLVVSYFSYSQRVSDAFLDISTDRVIHILIPMKTPVDISHKNSEWIRYYSIPYVTQEEYDKLLWSMDINFVRGEDSFVRAILAGKPFFWNIYPQDENTHILKLNAFMQRYCQTLDVATASVWKELNLAINTFDIKALQNLWPKFVLQWSYIESHAKIWPNFALNGEVLASRLVKFIKSI